MKELERIRLAYMAQLGSLEDNTQVKRLTPESIRKLRAQAHRQSQLHFSIVRGAAKTWSNLLSTLALLFTHGIDECDKNGHRAQHYGSVVRCYQCGVEIRSIEQLVRLD